MIFDGITNVMEGDSFPNAALAASGNEPPFALYYDFLFFNVFITDNIPIPVIIRDIAILEYSITF